MFGRRMTARPAIMLMATGALLWSCSSDTHAPSASNLAQPRAALDRHHGGLDGGVDAASSLDENPTISDFVLYAERSVTLGKGDRIQGGDIGVAALAVQSFGPQLTVGDASFVDPNEDLLAPSVQLGKDASVGDVETSTLTNNGGKLRLQAPLPTPMPAVPIALASTPGTSNVAVDRWQFQKLAPGAYANLTVNGTLLLEPGIFYFSAVTLGDGARVLTLPGRADVRIAGALATGQHARLSPLQPEDGWDDGWGPNPHCQHQPASQLSLSVFGYNAGTGTPLAAALGPQTSVNALLFAPHGTLSLGADTNAMGAFAGFDVSLGDRATVKYEAGFQASAPGQHGSQQLSGYITVAMASAPLVGPAPPDLTPLIGVGLPVQNIPGLQAAITAVSDPTSGKYLQFGSPASFAANYTDANAYAELAAFLLARGFSTIQTLATNIFLTAIPSVAQIESTFYTSINLYQRPDGTQFYGPAVEPSLDFTPTVLRITGLDDYQLGFPSYGAPIGQGANGPPNGAFAGLDLRNAYLGGTPCLALLGDGQTITLYEDNNFNFNDIAQYASISGISTLTQLGFPGSQLHVEQDCNTAYFSSCFNGNANPSEVAVDIAVALSMAPRATIIVHENGNQLTGRDSFLWEVANSPTAYPVVSDSWFDGWDDNGTQAMWAMAYEGVTYFYASTDVGAFSSLSSDGLGGAQGYNYFVADTLVGMAKTNAATRRRDKSLPGERRMVGNRRPIQRWRDIFGLLSV